MWRATIMALGLCLCILGAECMVVDRVVMADATTDSLRKTEYDVASPFTAYDELSTFDASSFPGTGRRVFVPPEWAPWGLLAAGALTFLYSTALPGAAGEE